jgi:O-antigen ligase
MAIKQIKTTNYNLKNGQIETKNDRLMIWDVSLNIIKDNFWFGVGNGDIKDKLVENYKKYNIQEALKDKLNAHNQFIETFCAQGIIGFLILWALLIISFIQSLKYKNILLTLFIIIIVIHFSFESMLNSQLGVIFFSFFFSFLNFINNENNIFNKKIIEQ